MRAEERVRRVGREDELKHGDDVKVICLQRTAGRRGELDHLISCIEWARRFGTKLGYHMTLVPDATAAFSAEGMRAAATNAPMFARPILKTDEHLSPIGRLCRIP